MNPKPDIAGQLILWNKGPSPRAGINTVQAFGVLGLPKALAEKFCADDTLKRLVFGSYVPDLGLRLVIGEEGGERLPSPEYRKSMTADQLFTSPVWRV